MFISVTDSQKKHIAVTGFVYLLVSLFCILFGFIYERFSHEVYSGHMIYAFAYPLAGGVLPFYGLSVSSCRRMPGRLALNLYHSGIAALTVGSIFKGILEIYGTANDLVRVYWFCGFTMAGIGAVMYLAGLILYETDSTGKNV